MNSKLLDELAWLFKVESVRENSHGRQAESFRLFLIARDIEERAQNKRREEFEASYIGDLT
jgi:hypothetical protein